MRLDPSRLPDTDDWVNDAPFVQAAIAKAGEGADEPLKLTLEERYRSFSLYEHLGRRFPWLSNPDDYYWLRGARRIAETGHPWDELREGIPWDAHAAAPEGRPLKSNAHFQVLAGLQDAGARFDLPPMQSAAYFGVLATLLSFVPAFLAGWRLGGPAGGFLSLSAVALAPAALQRTLWGNADTDGYNLFFPLLVLWLLVETLQAGGRLRWAALLAGALGVYTFFWRGWFLTYDLVLGALLFHAVLLAATKAARTDRLRFAGAAALAAVVPLLVVALFNHESSVLAPLEPLHLARLWTGARGIGAGSPLLPNVDATVAEAQPISWRAVADSVGVAPLAGAIAGVLALAVLGLRRGSEWLLSVAVLALAWLIVFFVAGMRANRMTLLLPPALVLGIGGLCRWLQGRALARLANAGLFVGGLALLSGPASTSLHLCDHRTHLPAMNRAWERLFQSVRQKTAASAIVTTWWDQGHLVSWGADRAVTLDGASQSDPQTFWVARAFTSADEDEAAGILRMLACSGGLAHARFAAALGDEAIGAHVLGEVVRRSRAQADALLAARGIDGRDALLALTHCAAREQVVVVSSAMMRASSAWARFGGWSFAKAWLWSQRALPDDALTRALARFDLDPPAAASLVRELRALPHEAAAESWISPPRHLNLLPLASCQRSRIGLECANGVLANPASGLAAVAPPLRLVPEGLAYWNEQSARFTVQAVNGGSGRDATVVIFEDPGGGLATGLLPSALAPSLFTRLFLLNGRGLSRFTLLSREPFPDGDWVSAFSVQAQTD